MQQYQQELLKNQTNIETAVASSTDLQSRRLHPSCRRLCASTTTTRRLWARSEVCEAGAVGRLRIPHAQLFLQNFFSESCSPFVFGLVRKNNVTFLTTCKSWNSWRLEQHSKLSAAEDLVLYINRFCQPNKSEKMIWWNFYFIQGELLC